MGGTAGSPVSGTVTGTAERIAEVRGLTVTYGDVPALSEVSLAIEPGGSLALVGESGSGKSTLAGALLGHLRPGARLAAGSVLVDDTDVFAAPPRRLRELRSRAVAFVPQSASAALTPTMRVGAQLTEVLRGTQRQARRARGGGPAAPAGPAARSLGPGEPLPA